MTVAELRSLRFRKPMLAKNIDKHWAHIVYPCFVQPKLDGVRCITDGRRFWSKNGKEFPIKNTDHLRVPRFPHLIDGELMLDDGADFEEIVSIIKRAGHERCEELRFNAFDVITDELFSRRMMYLRHLFVRRQTKIMSAHWDRVRTFNVKSKEELFAAHRAFLEVGFEGTMVRNPLGLYESKRSNSLLKWKPLQDAEFTIIDVKEAKGKDKGTPIFICETQDGSARFSARPMGSMKQRQQMWKNRHTLPGQPLTVQYQNLTKYGVPRFPRAKVLRDYE